MSLDVYIRGEEKDCESVCVCCGHKHIYKDREEYYSNNITHNLGGMARKAGLYEALWIPEEHGYFKAKDIIPVLEKGLTKLSRHPEKYKKYDSPNGWGTYQHFIEFVADYLAACKEHPEGNISVSR